MEIEISRSCLKWSDSCPHPELVESSPSRLIRSLQDILLVFCGRHIFKVSSFFNSPTNTLHAFSSTSCLPYAPHVSSSFISLSPEQCSVCSINHEALHFPVFSSLLLPSPLRSKYLHHHHVLQHPEHLPCLMWETKFHTTQNNRQSYSCTYCIMYHKLFKYIINWRLWTLRLMN